MRNFTPEDKNQIQELLAAKKLLAALNFIDEQNTVNDIIMLKGRVNRLEQQKESMPLDAYNKQLEEIKKSIHSLVGLEYKSQETAPSNYIKENLEQSENFKKRIQRLYRELSPNTPTYDQLLLLTQKYDQLKKENILGIITQETYMQTKKQIDSEISKMEEMIS